MLKKEDLEGAKVVFPQSAKVTLLSGRVITVRFIDGAAFEENGHRLDDGNLKGEEALRELITIHLFKER